jgi:hypothetical protein
VAVVPFAPLPAQAQWLPYGGWPGDAYEQRSRPRPPLRAAQPAKPSRLAPVEAAQRKPEGPMFAVVAVAEQRVYIHDANGMIASSPVSTGMAGHRTPTGIFSIIQKNRWHKSNIYSGAPMPYMQRITWSGIAMHEGMLPGYPASHGCIRLPHAFAIQWWGMTRLGVRVVVSPHNVAFSAFDSASLPKPVFVAASVADATPVLQQTKLAATETRAGESLIPAAAAATGPRKLNPAENAIAVRNRLRTEAADAVKAAKAANEASLRASVAAREAAADLRRAESGLASAREEERADVEAAVADARARESVQASAAYAAGRAARQAEDASEAAAQSLKVAERAVEPLQVFISRKERKLYVRQGFMPIFDAPVTFKDPDAPIGTHVYSATASNAGGDGLRWTSLTMPEPGAAADREPVRRGQRTAAPAAPAAASTAAAALARVEISADVMQRLNEKVWVGASLIVSDYPMSGETGLGTDFIVLTK